MQNTNEDFKRQLEYIKKIKEKDCQRSFSFLLREYEPLLKSYTSLFLSRYPRVPMDYDDMMNELRFSFYTLIKNFDETKGKFFGSYIKEFLYWTATNKVNEFLTNKHNTLNNAYAETDDSIKDTFISDDKYYDEKIINILSNKNLSNIESYVVKGLADGKNMKILSKESDIKIKTLYSARDRARLKLNKMSEN